MADEPKLQVHRWPAGRPLDQGRVAEAWAKEGFSCGLWVGPPLQSWLDYVHSIDERLLLKEGTIVLDIDGVSATLQVGDEVCIPAGARHSIWNRTHATVRWYYGYRKKERPKQP
jgi:mannose-6-phosphate isomerase-like protein (cupin superfamily)